MIKRPPSSSPWLVPCDPTLECLSLCPGQRRGFPIGKTLHGVHQSICRSAALSAAATAAPVPSGGIVPCVGIAPGWFCPGWHSLSGHCLGWLYRLKASQAGQNREPRTSAAYQRTLEHTNPSIAVHQDPSTCMHSPLMSRRLWRPNETWGSLSRLMLHLSLSLVAVCTNTILCTLVRQGSYFPCSSQSSYPVGISSLHSTCQSNTVYFFLSSPCVQQR